MGKIKTNSKSEKVKKFVEKKSKTKRQDKKGTKNINKNEKKKPTISMQKKAEYAAKAEEKAIRIKQQKAKRLEKNIIISKRTRKGQPLMKDRINYLLKKIQQNNS